MFMVVVMFEVVLVVVVMALVILEPLVMAEPEVIIPLVKMEQLVMPLVVVVMAGPE